MALILHLKSVKNLEGRYDRVVKINFRDFEKTTKVVRGRSSVDFDEEFKWPVGRKLDAMDIIELKLYNFSKYLNNKAIGSITISLQKLIEESKISYEENMIDANHSIIMVIATFDITYYSPDSQIGDWQTHDFDQPVADSQKLGVMDDLSDENGDEDKKALLGHKIDEHTGLINFGQDDENESMLSGDEQDGDVSIGNKNLGVPLTLQPTLHKTDDWQISITVIEARQLAGANINPLIEVRVGDKTKTTEVQMSTNSPYYNQFLCFDFHMSKAELFDQVIRIRALGMGNMVISRLLPGDLIGEFRMDVRTVYNAPDRMFLHKWAMLVDPKDILGGAKGYVKVDILILGKGEQVKNKTKSQVKKPKSNEDEDIEANLLIPQTVKSTNKRQMAEIAVKIYRAEDLPRMNTDFMASIKQAFTGETKPLVDPFVQVSFAGHTNKTKTKRHTYSPEWNEEVVFTESFPPLCHRIRVSVFDSDTVYNECIATHFVDLNLIMNEGDTGFLPTFGPAWVNLYGTPRNYTYEQMMRPKEELNRGLGEGVAYRGRLLLAIKTSLKSDSAGLPAGAKVYSVPPISDGTCGKKEPFLLIGAFYEASVIDSEIGKKKLPVSFELSIGTTGNRLDSESQEGGPSDAAAPSQANKPKIPKWCHSNTPPMIPETNDSVYYHMSFNERKPCLYMISYHEDHRPRLFVPNIIEKLRTEFSNGIDSIHDMHISERRGTHIRLRNLLDKCHTNIETAQNCIKCCRSVSPKTLLDKERQKVIKVALEKMRLKVKAMRGECTRAQVGVRLKECRAILKRLNELIPNPQDSCQDIFIWMIQENKRMAFARIPARDVIFSSVLEERGKKNSEVVTVFLQKPGREGMGQSGWTLQGQLKMYLWLGLLRDMKTFQQGLPLGYDDECFKFRRPPMEIVYKERSYFQLRGHMFMARNLIGSDESGLSDAFARILVNDHVVTTKVVYETLSPKWDQTLIIDHMVFYYSKDLIYSNPPVLVVELFDEDTVTSSFRGNQKGKSEFLGRCFCKPAVALDEEDYRPPKLTWWEIYRGQMNAGELLAAFELIQIFPDEGYRLANGMPRPEEMVTDVGLQEIMARSSLQQTQQQDRQSQNLATLPNQNGGLSDNELGPGMQDPANAYSMDTMSSNRRPDRMLTVPGNDPTSSLVTGDNATPGLMLTEEGHTAMPVPMEIRPSLIMYRVEVMFWGMREMQRIQLMTVDRPKVTIEFGGNHLFSEVIHSCKAKPNFSNPVKYMDIMLPENLMYWPPMMIQCEDSRQFGRTVLVGTHVIANVTKYIVKDKSKVEDELTPQHSPAPRNMNSNIQNMLDSSRALQNSTGSPINLKYSASAANQTLHSPILTDRVQFENASFKSQKLYAVSPSPVETPVHHPGYKDDKRPLVSRTSSSVAGTAAGSVKQLSISAASGTPAAATAVNTGGSGGVQNKAMVNEPAKIGQPVAIKKKTKIPKDDLADIDWWSKYYVSMEEADENDEESSDSDLDILKDIEVEIKSDGEDQEGLAEIPEDEEDGGGGGKNKKKKKKRKKKKKNKDKNKKKTGLLAKFPFKKEDMAKKYLLEKDEEEDDEEEHVKPEYHDLIERFKVYLGPLEDVKEFGGFLKFVKTFPLQKGKQEDEEEMNDNRTVGHFKGNLMIYTITDEEFGMEVETNQLLLYRGLPSNESVQIIVRLYVIRANDLHPTDPNGKADPYLLIRLGNKVVNDKENYIPKQLNPVFGKCFEMDVKFPQESMLCIEVMDWDLVSGDDLIGETKIDLENRYYSQHKALCGLMGTYENHGYNKWRDQLLPSQFLAKLCKEYSFDAPKYEPLVNKVTVAGIAFYADSEVEEDSGEKKQSNEPLALEVLKNWSTIPGGCQLVPDHIETRPLFNPEKPGIGQGALELWVDMFPKELGAPPAPVDITPRSPEGYELRVIIWNTEDVILADDSMLSGEKSSDIFVKGWMKGLGIDDQVTDVHYRSLSGEGNFNWRFVYQFEYIKAEDKVVYKIKDSPFSIDETEIKSPCKLFLQVWDADIVSSDDFLGGLELLLSKIPRGAKSSQTCGLHQLNKDGSVPTINIFKNKRYRGWWPFTAEGEDEPNELEVTGKVDAEFQLLSKDEGEATPVGLGREEPSPLPAPNRPDSSFLNFMNPLKTLKYLICKKFKWLLIKLLIVSCLIALLVLFIYNIPGNLSRLMMGMG